MLPLLAQQLIDMPGTRDWVQGGFAILAAVLIAVLIWVLRENRQERRENKVERTEIRGQLVGLLEKTNESIDGNTQIIAKVCDKIDTDSRTLAGLRDLLLSRRCMAERERE